MLAEDLRFWVINDSLSFMAQQAARVLFLCQFLLRRREERTCSWTSMRIFLEDILKEAEILYEEVREIGVSANVILFALRG